jgi:hypothetical protein
MNSPNGWVETHSASVGAFVLPTTKDGGVIISRRFRKTFHGVKVRNVKRRRESNEGDVGATGDHRKELNFAPVAPTSAHTENLADTKKYERPNSVPPKAGGCMQVVVVWAG